MPICEIHNKEMRQNSKGYFCSTPIEKSPDGKTVIKWCTYKPEMGSTATNPAIEAKKEEIREKLAQPNWDEIAEGKVRHGVAVAFIGSQGINIDADLKELMEQWVEWIMTGS